MNRRLLARVAVVAGLAMIAGFAGVDRWLAEAVHASGLESARLFSDGLYLLDAISGFGLSIWVAPSAVFASGAIGFAMRRAARWPRALILAAIVQLASILTMIAMKDHFGRLRPFQVFGAGHWNHLWFAGGVSFPSGHSAFYFGVLLPLAAAASRRWLRMLLIAIAVFVITARIDLAKHFLSDVAASALFASIYAWTAATLARNWLAKPPTTTR